VLHKLAARGGGDAALSLPFKTHPQPGERLSQLGEALTPRIDPTHGKAATIDHRRRASARGTVRQHPAAFPAGEGRGAWAQNRER